MANIKRLIKEDGIVLEKIFKKASDEIKLSDGRVIEAQPDRYILKCISGEDFSKETGFLNSTVLDYKVEKNVFDKVVAYSPVIVKYDVSNYGAKAVTVELKESK